MKTKWRRFLISSRVYLALFIALVSPYLPMMDAAVRRASMTPISRINRIEAARPSYNETFVDRAFKLESSTVEDGSFDVGATAGPLTHTKTTKILSFIQFIDVLSEKYQLSPELVRFRQVLADRVGYTSPFCGGPLVIAGFGAGLLTLIVIGVVVYVVAVVVIAIVTNGGSSDPTEAAREALRQRISDCYRQLEIFRELLTSAETEAEIAAILALIAQKWQEIDDLLRQLWNLLYPGDGRYFALLDIWDFEA